MDQMVNNIWLTCKLTWMLRTYRTCNSVVRFSNFEFYKKLLVGVTLLRVKPGITWTQLYIYIYILSLYFYFTLFSLLFHFLSSILILFITSLLSFFFPLLFDCFTSNSVLHSFISCLHSFRSYVICEHLMQCGYVRNNNHFIWWILHCVFFSQNENP